MEEHTMEKDKSPIISEFEASGDLVGAMEEQGMDIALGDPLSDTTPINQDTNDHIVDIFSSDIPETILDHDSQTMEQTLPETDVYNVRVEASSGCIRLLWSWPENSSKAAVVFSYEDYPKHPKDGDAIIRHVTLEDYEKNNGLSLEQPKKRNHFFSIFLTAEEGGTVVFSDGAQCACAYADAPTIQYGVVVHRGFLGAVKSAFIYLWGRGEAFDVPEMRLLKKEGEVPSHKDDGHELLILPAGAVVDETPLQIPIDPQVIGDDDMFRLFIVEDQSSCRFLLEHPTI